MEEAAKEKDVYHIMCYDEQFHSCIVRAAKCETLYKIWAMLRESNLCGYYTCLLYTSILLGLAANLITDLCYCIVDPRIKLD